jgi:hypothetical protein
MAVSEQELHFQATKLGEALKETIPAGSGVGFAVLFFNQDRRDTPVAFACNAVTEQEKRAVVEILRGFANALNPSRIITLS